MTAAYRFGLRSQANLIHVHPDLVRVVTLALRVSSVDFSIIEGRRTPARQKELYAQGRTLPGKIVTWTMQSRHLTGHAVDLLPINPQTKQGDWAFVRGFDLVAKAMKAASDELAIPIRWGADWNGNGVPHEKGEQDSPHWELDKDKYP